MYIYIHTDLLLLVSILYVVVAGFLFSSLDLFHTVFYLQYASFVFFAGVSVANV